VILLTAWTHLESAVDLVKAGAADYLAKPWDDRKLMVTVNNLLELAEARRELAQAQLGERRRRDALLRDYDLRGIVYADPASENALALACQVARRICRCWSPARTVRARKRSPRSCTRIRWCGTAPSSR
jgi:FixJ family two-component response regulator